MEIPAIFFLVCEDDFLDVGLIITILYSDEVKT